ncbi:NUDIX hydrolase [Dactylosporangium sp. AC04546]|uniref:NUDIX hydrolase n=1 Tax=Dactylosporangium sp. AC04546 TaxID=2862460 RepID=UPI001EDFE9E7|nr:NUDIX hydrolase [Dactylosporangium sp. AC04546]WVK82211.1 NUDIX hydrolase [Dactylosporangium sp. AC04546]
MKSRLRAFAYRTFYRLPGRWKRRIVRTFQPTYTIGAVILVRDPEKSRILLLRQPPGAGWSLPAGLMDRGETPVQTAARELAEETSIKLPAERFRAANPNAVVHTRGQWVDMVFETEVEPEDSYTVDAAEVLEAAWHRLDTLPPLTVATSRLLAHYGIGPYKDYPEVLSR